MIPTFGAKFAIYMWQGPKSKAQDFHYGNWAIEIKTSVSKLYQKIQVSDEQQLNDIHFNDGLHLLFITLIPKSNDPNTINQIINEISIARSNKIELKWNLRNYYMNLDI